MTYANVSRLEFTLLALLATVTLSMTCRPSLCVEVLRITKLIHIECASLDDVLIGHNAAS